MPKETSVFSQVYKIVMQIPKGQVLTYGLIADRLDGRLSPQGVGWALNALPSPPAKTDKDKPKYHSGNVPWHRVINSRGGTSTHKILHLPPEIQRKMLESEGLVFNEEEKVELARYLFTGDLV